MKDCRCYPRVAVLAVLACLVTAVLGCSDKPEMAPVSGTVTYRGEPLKFGSVMFQHKSGRAAGDCHDPARWILSADYSQAR
jgi:hypothetical protein